MHNIPQGNQGVTPLKKIFSPPLPLTRLNSPLPARRGKPHGGPQAFLRPSAFIPLSRFASPTVMYHRSTRLSTPEKIFLAYVEELSDEDKTKPKAPSSGAFVEPTLIFWLNRCYGNHLMPNQEERTSLSAPSLAIIFVAPVGLFMGFSPTRRPTEFLFNKGQPLAHHSSIPAERSRSSGLGVKLGLNTVMR